MNKQIETTKAMLRELGWTDALDEAAKQIEVSASSSDTEIFEKVKEFDKNWQSLQE